MRSLDYLEMVGGVLGIGLFRGWMRTFSPTLIPMNERTCKAPTAFSVSVFASRNVTFNRPVTNISVNERD